MTSASIAIAIPAGAERKICCYGPWRSRAPDRTILVAGCGTSQAARHALMEPEARVTAIDISETSLRHTRDLQEKHGIRNLRLHRLAIERIEELGETFDQIVCTGVLHHLSDPDVGLRSLRDVLARDGAMHIMVYAPYGRAGVYMMQDYCRLLGDRRAGRGTAGAWRDDSSAACDHPIAGVVKRAKDFARPDALADALLNPQDRAYSVPELYDWLERCGLKFGRWHEQAPYLPQCGAIAPRPAWRRALPRFPRARNMRRWSSCAGRWTGTVSSPIATIANAKPSPSHSRATYGAASFRFGFPGR